MQKVLFVNPFIEKDKDRLNKMLSDGWKVINVTSGANSIAIDPKANRLYYERSYKSYGNLIFSFVLEKVEKR